LFLARQPKNQAVPFPRPTNREGRRQAPPALAPVLFDPGKDEFQ
jgi:hypothetical protein